MIKREEIDSMAERMGVLPSNVQRDYVSGWLLSVIYGSSPSPMAKRLVLKGGNCLRKAYFENGRYSGDLDFSCAYEYPNAQLGQDLNTICAALMERTGVRFDLTRTRVDDKFELDGGKIVSEARVYFRDFYGAESHVIVKVKLDVTQYDRLYLPVQTRPLIHPYSDASACAVAIRCVKLEEVLATKMRCLLQRRHIPDFFDLVHGTLTSTGSINLRELIYVFFRVTVFGGNPNVVKGLFADLPFVVFGGLWDKYISCPKSSRLPFETAKDAFTSLIEKLIPGKPQHTKSFKFFASDLRAPIMQAADDNTLLRIRYKGKDRLVEAYELVFKVPKNGEGREYLFVHDTTGGRSTGPGPKWFVSENVQRIENTDQTFVPRWPVELKKAGSAERITSFSRK
jgi:predicted nucleotidyltransferase component of viral defense system